MTNSSRRQIFLIIEGFLFGMLLGTFGVKPIGAIVLLILNATGAVAVAHLIWED